MLLKHLGHMISPQLDVQIIDTIVFAYYILSVQYG